MYEGLINTGVDAIDRFDSATSLHPFEDFIMFKNLRVAYAREPKAMTVVLALAVAMLAVCVMIAIMHAPSGQPFRIP